MNLIAVANETLKICEAGSYEVKGRIVVFPEGDYDAVEVITPEMGEALLAKKLQAP